MKSDGEKSGATKAFRITAMKGLLLLVPLLMSGMLVAQNGTTEKPCIAFSPESTSPTNEFAKDPLEAAVMLSGDFVFYAGHHDGCWNVHVISLPIISAKSRPMGYAVSHTVTDPQRVEVGHALTFGPDRDIFMDAMRKAAADAIRNVRLARSVPKQDPQ
jgi:hypothetical protein